MSDLSGVGRFLLITGLVLSAVGALLISGLAAPGIGSAGPVSGRSYRRTGAGNNLHPHRLVAVISVLLTIVLNLILRR